MSTKSFKPKITITSGEVPGYGGPGYHWVTGVYDNRRLFEVQSQSESAAAIQGERERVKWEKRWPSRAKFLAAIKHKKLASPLCSNCGKPGGNSSCLDKRWCSRPECRRAMEDAIAEYERSQERRKVDDEARHAQEKKDRIRKCDETATGFHWRNGWYFKRQPDGSVRIIHRETPTSEWLRVDLLIPAPEWASILCGVSAAGETADRWDAAQDFHGRVGAPT